MDAFESVIAAILQRQGFWTLTSVKVDLTKEEKRQIGRHSSPRWELDVVGYRGSDNELRVVECKSFLDSPGVQSNAFEGGRPDYEKRYKIFFDTTLRQVVLRRLVRQMVAAGFCAKRPKVKLCLAAGKINGDTEWLVKHFAKRGWHLYTPDFIREELRVLSTTGYENTVAAVVAKILLRESKSKTRGSQVDAAV